MIPKWCKPTMRSMGSSRLVRSPIAETYTILTTDAFNLRRDPLWRCEQSVYKARPETIRRRSVARRRSGGAFKCGLWWRAIRSLLPNFVVPVALMFSSDKVTVVGNGNGGLYPACAQAHVRRQRLQVPVGGPTQIR